MPTVRLAAKLGKAAPTIGAVLRREQPRLSDMDRITGELIRSRRHSQVRYQHRNPGSLLHVDVRKPAGFPPGSAGWPTAGSSPVRPSTAPPAAESTSRCDRRLHQTCCTCTCTCTAPPPGWFRDPGVTVRPGPDRQRLGLPARHRPARGLLRTRGQAPVHPAPRPPTSGKGERFNRILQSERAYSTAWTSRAGLAPWLQH